MIIIDRTSIEFTEFNKLLFKKYLNADVNLKKIKKQRKKLFTYTQTV